MLYIVKKCKEYDSKGVNFYLDENKVVRVACLGENAGIMGGEVARYRKQASWMGFSL
jgi:hypothetical protein